MHEQTKNDISLLIQDNQSAIKNPYTKIHAQLNPEIHKNMMNDYLSEIKLLTWELQARITELIPFVGQIKWSTSDITEETHICAIYLLLCSVISEWESVCLLAKEWKYTSIMAILRKISEALDQCQLFILNSQDWEDKHLKDWFLGKIISNGVARKRISEATPKEAWVDVDSLLSHLYQMESNTTHNGYVSMLEGISPFTEDFDFDWSTRYYRTIWALGFAKGNITDFIQVLRLVFFLLLRDTESEARLEAILKIHDPSIWKNEIPQKIKDTFKPKNTT